MRAAEGIFRTVNKPFGQVDARPSKSYRISWNGVCPLGRSQNDNSSRRPFYTGQFLEREPLS